MLTWARGTVCIFPQDQQDPVWVPERLVRRSQHDDTSASSPDESTRETETEMGNPVGVSKANAELDI